jgi:DNA-binding protein YbaB
MKKIMTCLVLVLTVCSFSALQAQQDQAQRNAAMKQRLIDSLKMTSVQADSVVAIQQEFRPQMRAIFMDQSLSQDDKQSKMAPIMAAENQRLQAVLGDDLFKQYQAFAQRNRPQRGGGGGGGGSNQ